jgi:hypothetical protein
VATTRLVRIDTYAPVPTSLTLLDGATDTGYNLLADTSFGDAAWEHVEAGVRGTQGKLAATGYPVERAARLAVRIAGASKATSDARVAALDAAVDELRQYGGRVCVRENGSSVRMYLDVLRVAGVQTASRNDATARRDLAIDLVCGPYLLGDPLDTIETWATDTVSAGEWTVDEGAVTRTGGGNCLLSGQTRIRLTGPGYTNSDCEAILQYTTPGSTAGISAMIAICADTSGADTMLGVELTSAAIRSVKRVAGTPTTLGTTAYSPAASTTYWIAIRREGGKLVAEVYTVQPVMGLDTPAATATYTMTVAEQAQFVRGHAVIRLNSTSAAVAIGEARVRPYTYQSVSTPTNLPLGGAVPGTAPALADLHITATTGSGAGGGGTIAQTYPIYLLAGWAVVQPHNRAHLFGDIAYSSSLNLLGTVTNVVTASSTMSAGATARYGRNAIQCATAGGSASQGVAQRVFGEYRQGRVVCALGWMRAASGTPSVFLRLRASASSDGADSGTAALSTSAWTLYSCAWTPSADRNDVYVAGVVSGTTAATFLLDGVVVWECDPAALSASMSAGTSGARETITVTATPDTVQAPCLALIESELVQVESISGSSWTIVRGREGTTAGAHAGGTPVYALPPNPNGAKGDGGFAPIGVIHAANATQNSAASTVQTDSDYASGSGSRNVGGQVLGELGDVCIDPSAIPPDPYTGTVDVDVYARTDIDSEWLTLTLTPYMTPTFASASQPRYTIEFGSTGKTPLRPADATGLERFAYLGSFSFPRDSGTWVMRTLFSGSVSGGVVTNRVAIDYYLVVPRRTSARGPEGKDGSSTTYPYAFPSTSTQRARVFESDGAGYIVPNGRPDMRIPYHGIGGSAIELDPGVNTVTAKLGNHVPDFPVEGTGSDYTRYGASVHVAVTPRYMTLRDA